MTFGIIYDLVMLWLSFLGANDLFLTCDLDIFMPYSLVFLNIVSSPELQCAILRP